jgi:hypothetical protein
MKKNLSIITGILLFTTINGPLNARWKFSDEGKTYELDPQNERPVCVIKEETKKDRLELIFPKDGKGLPIIKLTNLAPLKKANDRSRRRRAKKYQSQFAMARSHVKFSWREMKKVAKLKGQSTRRRVPKLAESYTYWFPVINGNANDIDNHDVSFYLLPRKAYDVEALLYKLRYTSKVSFIKKFFPERYKKREKMKTVNASLTASGSTSAVKKFQACLGLEKGEFLSESQRKMLDKLGEIKGLENLPKFHPNDIVKMYDHGKKIYEKLPRMSELSMDIDNREAELNADTVYVGLVKEREGIKESIALDSEYVESTKALADLNDVIAGMNTKVDELKAEKAERKELVDEVDDLTAEDRRAMAYLRADIESYGRAINKIKGEKIGPVVTRIKQKASELGMDTSTIPLSQKEADKFINDSIEDLDTPYDDNFEKAKKYRISETLRRYGDNAFPRRVLGRVEDLEIEEILARLDEMTDRTELRLDLIEGKKRQHRRRRPRKMKDRRFGHRDRFERSRRSSRLDFRRYRGKSIADLASDIYYQMGRIEGLDKKRQTARRKLDSAKRELKCYQQAKGKQVKKCLKQTLRYWESEKQISIHDRRRRGQCEQKIVEYKAKIATFNKATSEVLRQSEIATLNNAMGKLERDVESKDREFAQKIDELPLRVLSFKVKNFNELARGRLKLNYQREKIKGISACKSGSGRGDRPRRRRDRPQSSNCVEAIKKARDALNSLGNEARSTQSKLSQRYRVQADAMSSIVPEFEKIMDVETLISNISSFEGYYISLDSFREQIAENEDDIVKANSSISTHERNVSRIERRNKYGTKIQNLKKTKRKLAQAKKELRIEKGKHKKLVRYRTDYEKANNGMTHADFEARISESNTKLDGVIATIKEKFGDKTEPLAERQTEFKGIVEFLDAGRKAFMEWTLRKNRR